MRRTGSVSISSAEVVHRGSKGLRSSTKFSLNSCSQSGKPWNRSLCTPSRPSFFCFRFLLVHAAGFPVALHSYFHSFLGTQTRNLVMMIFDFAFDSKMSSDDRVPLGRAIYKNLCRNRNLSMADLCALPDECSCFLSSWGRPHLVLPTLRHKSETSTLCTLICFVMMTCWDGPWGGCGITCFGSEGRDETSMFLSWQIGTLFLLLRPGSSPVGTSVTHSPSSACVWCSNPFQSVLTPSTLPRLGRLLVGQCGQEGQEHVEVRTAQIKLASLGLHQLRVLPPSLPHVFDG